jgi:hypothetical protein
MSDFTDDFLYGSVLAGKIKAFQEAALELEQRLERFMDEASAFTGDKENLVSGKESEAVPGSPVVY